jgi:hypothetical protein
MHTNHAVTNDSCIAFTPSCTRTFSRAFFSNNEHRQATSSFGFPNNYSEPNHVPWPGGRFVIRHLTVDIFTCTYLYPYPNRYRHLRCRERSRALNTLIFMSFDAVVLEPKMKPDGANFIPTRSINPPRVVVLSNTCCLN